jgi:microcystin-dependent protein
MACVEDTNSIALNINLVTGALEASVRLSADPENIAQVLSDGLFVGAADLVIPRGGVIPFAGGSPPTGWLLCDGAAISRSTYAALFGVISVTYGIGDGSTTFNVPDLVGRVVIGLNAANTDIDTMGENDGLAAASRSIKHNHTNGLTLPDHVHSYTWAAEPPSQNAASGPNGGASIAGSNVYTGLTIGNPTTHPAINGTIGPGGSRPTDSAAFLVLKYIIKV